MVDQGCLSFPHVCLAYDICRLGRMPWQCSDLVREVIDNIVKAWMESEWLKIERTKKGVRVSAETLCRRYEQYLECYQQNPCGLQCMQACMQTFLVP